MFSHQRVLLFSILLTVSLILLAGCSHQPTAAERFQSYADAWQKENFTKMYSYLSDSSKKTISQSEFVSRYQKIYDGIGAGKLTVSVTSSKSNEKAVHFKATLSTAAGPVLFNESAPMVNEKDGNKTNWYLKWTPAQILPGLTKGDTVRVNTQTAKRGEILDRNEKPLAMNGTATRIDLVPGQMESGKGYNQTIQKISQLLGVPADKINQALKQNWVQADSLVPIKALPQSSTDLIKKVTALPGVYRTQITTRVYPDKQASGHLTGYIGSVTADFLKAHPDAGYTASSIVGRTGLEQIYEKQLRAQDGMIIRIVNAKGKEKMVVAQKAAKNGQNIQLTIDQKLQDALYQQMKNNTGSAVAIDPKTGDVLALVSAPSYDPNSFALGLSAADYQKLRTDKQEPLLNRFTEATAPGSTFKALTAAIALSRKTVDPNQSVSIKGKNWQPDKSWGNYHVTRLDSAANVNLVQALYQSDNIYFAQTALKIGAARFAQDSKKYGLGESIPFPYPMQTSTLSNNGKLDSSMLLANSGYGQGQVSVTPLQMSLIYSAFVNDGSMIRPRLIKTSQAPQIWKKNVMTPKIAGLLNNDLQQVIDNPAGTAHDAQISGLPMAGKTGTPEFKKKQGESGRENGWFVAYNTQNPKLLVTMIVENTPKNEGSHYITPKVRAVFKQYFGK